MSGVVLAIIDVIFGFFIKIWQNVFPIVVDLIKAIVKYFLEVIDFIVRWGKFIVENIIYYGGLGFRYIYIAVSTLLSGLLAVILAIFSPIIAILGPVFVWTFYFLVSVVLAIIRFFGRLFYGGCPGSEYNPLNVNVVNAREIIGHHNGYDY